MFFPLLIPGLFPPLFMVLCVHSSMCMQGQMKEEQHRGRKVIYFGGTA